MSAGKLTTNLGDQAQTQRLLAGSVSASYYQQPFQQLGTLAVPLTPNTNITIPYVAGYTKYVCYVTSSTASTVALLQTFTILNCPVNLVGTFTVSGSSNWILNGVPLIGTFPVFSDAIIIPNASGIPPPLSSSITMNIVSTVSPVYSSGTPIYKLVINLNAD